MHDPRTALTAPSLALMPPDAHDATHTLVIAVDRVELADAWIVRVGTVHKILLSDQ